MIVLDASVAVKWFKPRERFAAEALWLLEQIGNFRNKSRRSWPTRYAGTRRWRV